MPGKPRIILDSKQFDLTITRLCYQLIENHDDFSGSALIGLQPRGINVSKRLHEKLVKMTGNKGIKHGTLDVTFHRDDFRTRDTLIIPKDTKLDFEIEDKKVILIDDVLFTGRTIRAGMDALLVFGRPKRVELLALIDRRYTRDLPISPNYIGKTVNTSLSERVSVEWKEIEGKDCVKLYTVKK